MPGSGLWLANGNDIYNSNSADVGIGITNPSGKFHVYSGAATNNIYFNGGSQGGTGYDVNLYVNGGANNSEMSINMGIVGNEDRDRIKTYQGNMYFRTNDSERMRINSQGQTWLGGSFTGSDIANGNGSYLNNLNAGGFSVLHRNASDVYLHFNTYYNSSNNYTAKYGGSQGFRIDNGATGGLGFYKAPVVNTAGDTQTFSHVMQVGYGTSNNVGIGTPIPDYKLDIRNGELTVRPSSSGNGGLGKIGHSSSNAILQLYDSSANENVRISTSLSSYFNGGNVGIGTTLPIGKFNVSKDSTTDGLSQAITVSSSSVSTKRMNLGYVPGSNYAFIDVINYAISNTNQALSLQPNGGNVGIGTTSPSWQLEVENTGTVRAAVNSTSNGSSGVFFRVFDSGTQVGNGTIATQNNGDMKFFTGTSGEGARIIIDSVGAIQFNNYDSTNKTGTPTYLLGTDASGNVVKTLSSSAPGSLWAANGNDIYNTNSANVGIGVTSPNAKLSLAGGSNINSQNSILYIDTNSYYATAADRYITTSTAARYIQLNGSHIWSNAPSGTAGNAISFTERMRISSAGDVGIGTSSFNHFTSTKELLIEGDATNTNSVLQVISYDNLSSLAIYSGAFSTDDPAIIYQNDLRFGSTNGVGLGGYSEKMRITNGGNVGIGTTLPDAKLEIKKQTTWGTLDNQVIYINNTGTGGNTGLLHDMGSITWRSGNVNTAAISGIRNTPGSGNNVDLRFTTATQSGGQQTSMTIASGGNVGIGTTSPSAKLHVKNRSDELDMIVRLEATRDAYLQFSPANTTKWALIADYPATGDFTTYNYPNNFNSIIFKDNKDITTNLSGGNFGIGVTGPATKLHVMDYGSSLGITTDTGLLIGGTGSSGQISQIEVWLY